MCKDSTSHWRPYWDLDGRSGLKLGGPLWRGVLGLLK